MRTTLLAFLAVLACGSDSSGPSGRPVSVSDMAGGWSLTLTDTANCATGFVNEALGFQLNWDPNGAFYPTAFDVDVGSSTWGATSTNGWVSGFLPLRLPRGARLVATAGPVSAVPPDSLRHSFEVSGTVDVNLRFTGTVTDPVPPFQPALSPHPCTFRARGGHV